MSNLGYCVGGLIMASLGLAGCAGSTEVQTGQCQVTRCTGVCLEQVQQFARDQLGSEARDVVFSWDGESGGTAPTMLGGTAYFSTAACTSGQYQLDFHGNAASCTDTFYGKVPNFIGKLLVVPEGCAGGS